MDYVSRWQLNNYHDMELVILHRVMWCSWKVGFCFWFVDFNLVPYPPQLYILFKEHPNSSCNSFETNGLCPCIQLNNHSTCGTKDDKQISAYCTYYNCKCGDENMWLQKTKFQLWQWNLLWRRVQFVVCSKHPSWKLAKECITYGIQ